MFIFSLFLIASLVVVDQLVKYFAIIKFQFEPIVVIKGVFELTYVENRGGAWSILENKRLFFIITTIIILIVILYTFYKNIVHTNLGKFALVIVFAGAVGNFIDRLFRGYVVDMFNFKLINFPVFNVADICIVCGGIAFIYYVMFQHDAEEKKVQKNGK